MFSCEFYEIPFLKNALDGWFCVNTFSEAATRGVLCKNVFLEILQNSQENAEVFCKKRYS